MNRINIPALSARAEHFENMAARAYYQAATSAADGFPDAADEWSARAAEYESRAADARAMIRKAA